MSPKQQEDLVADILKYEELLLEWQKKGEEIMNSKAGWSIMFHIGKWWGERPWRNMEKSSD
jgi:hypothetical protein